jgi:hypothetical protein
MDVTETIRRLGNPKRLEVTVHASKAGDPEASRGFLLFDHLTVLSYV